MKRPFEGEDEKKPKTCSGVRALRRQKGNSILVNDVRLNTVTIRYDDITCRDIAFSDQADQPLSLFFSLLLDLAPLRTQAVIGIIRILFFTFSRGGCD